MDWKKVVLVAVFSVLAIYLQAVGILTAVSLLLYMLVKGMDNCRIANIGLLLEFIGVLLYPMYLLQSSGVLSLGSGLLDASVYLVFIGAILIIIALLVVMLGFNKVKGNIYEA